MSLNFKFPQSCSFKGALLEEDVGCDLELQHHKVNIKFRVFSKNAKKVEKKTVGF